MENYYPSAAEFGAIHRRRNMVLWGLFLAMVVVCFAIPGIIILLSPKVSAPAAGIAGIGIAITLAVPVMIFMQPRIGLYILMAGSILFDSSVTDLTIFQPTRFIPFFDGISTWGRLYGGARLPLPLSPVEILIILTTVAWIVRGVAARNFKFIGGAFLPWMLAYMVMVANALVYGFTSGGNTTMGLWEVRSQAYMFAGYILAANLITEPKQVRPMIWGLLACLTAKICIGVTAYFTVGVNGDQGFMNHEESVYFNLAFFILFITFIAKEEPAMRNLTLVLSPLAAFAIIANQRRSSIAAFIVAFIPLLPLLYRLLPNRRKVVGGFCATFAVALAVYLPAAWNSDGIWALPARAIKSQTSPSARDQSSDYYRLAELKSLQMTRDLRPWFGIGYGRPFGKFYGLADIGSEFQDYLPHNSVMWVWMRTGHLGFFAFLFLVAAVLVQGTAMLKACRTPINRLAGILAVLWMLMAFIFGKYDLGLSNFRVMTTLGLLLGVLSVLDRLEATESSETEPAAA
jgi:uncharacterized membrane protein (DUF485 family)